jgi:branched-chain amino acid transport system ATP-binding protein
LIGPNGAGKTTLFNVISGLQRPARGSVLIDDQDVTGLPVHGRAHLGVARTFQRLELFGSLSLRENVRVAADIHELHARRAPSTRRRSGISSETEAETEAILDRVGLRRYAHAPAHTVPTGLARLTELARALATKPRLLLLDEPGSGLDPSESANFGELLASLAADGIAVLLVEHDMDLVMQACGWVHVLDFGVLLASGSPEAIRADPVVQEAYLGHQPSGTVGRR